MGLKLSGVGAAENLDSSGEILSLKGLDTSSLHTLNFEHESKQASQIVGKILFNKKIYSEQDCETEDQLKYWNRLKLPFLYIIGELFDDVGHSGAADIAALAVYDKKHENEYDFRKTFPLIGFSVEGSKINKDQNIITHSLARKISVTLTPCNKVAWGSIYEEPEIRSAQISKTEKTSKAKELLQKILKSEDISLEQEVLIKHDIEDMEQLEKTEELVGGKGDYKPIDSFDQQEVKMGRIVEKEHTKSPKTAQEITADHLTEDPHYYSKLKDAGLADELEKAPHPVWSSRRAAKSIQKRETNKPQWSSRRAVNSMQKALTATASPLNPEILEPKMQMVTKSLSLTKSETVDMSIPTWGLVEKFKDFLKERVPSLTDKEAGAFTRAFKIFKIKAAEKKLKDL